MPNQNVITSAYWNSTSCQVSDLDDLRINLMRQNSQKPPFASDIQSNIPLYDCSDLLSQQILQKQQMSLYSEWAHILSHGAGVIVLKNALSDMALISDINDIFEDLLARQTNADADHFAEAGHNGRLWNGLEKLCLASPDLFAKYYANPFLAAIATAWLGPAYQITSQINIVRPGGKAQSAHRDYHLGFQSAEKVEKYPRHAHLMSQYLTLQGAVAHCDMPVESGSTCLLPFSQQYAPGYVAWHLPEFQHYFQEHACQLPLTCGDAVFFNPALFHAAGANQTHDIQRSANLLQISSAFGYPMEAIDRLQMCQSLYPVLQTHHHQKSLSQTDINNAIAACGESYPFPTNLDTDPPLKGLAPPTQQDLMKQGLAEEWSLADLTAALTERALKRNQRSPFEKN